MGMNFLSQVNEPDLDITLKSTENRISYNVINCCRVGILQKYYPETRTAKVLIANKLVRYVNDKGEQVTQNYAPLYAKVLFFGWGSSGITHPMIEAEGNEDGIGTEGILLFNDREIESWYINGQINNLAYDRAHAKTDCIFIAGIHSLPRMVQALTDCINIYNGNSNIQVRNSGININGNTAVTGNLTVSTGATGNIVDSDGRTCAKVVSGIITEIF